MLDFTYGSEVVDRGTAACPPSGPTHDAVWGPRCLRPTATDSLSCSAVPLDYFLDNQAAGGLILDRQANHGPRRPHGLCSIAATGMGFIALALARRRPTGCCRR